MSEQDFFFEDDQDVIEEKPKAAGKPKQKSSNQKTADKKTADSSKQSSKPAPKLEDRPAGTTSAQSVAMPIVALIAIVALLVGVIVGFLIAPKTPESSTLPESQQNSAPSGSMGEGTAPNLTEDQLNSGQMPAGHPSVDNSTGTGTDSGTGTGTDAGATGTGDATAK